METQPEELLSAMHKLGGREAVMEYMRHLLRQPKRQCGDCQLCCKLLPIAEVRKPSNQRCQHQCAGGCAIYTDRPTSCKMWNCEWVLGLEDTANMQRPDEVHYVIDTGLDIVTVMDEKLLVIQVWVDPDYPDAHEDPGLRDMLDRGRQPALIRFGAKQGFLLFPPSVTNRRGWIRFDSHLGPSP